MSAGRGRGIRAAPPRPIRAPPVEVEPPCCGVPATIGPGGGLPLTPSGPVCTPPIGTYDGLPAGTGDCWPSSGIPPNIMPPPIAAAVVAIMLLTNLRRDSMSINNSSTFPYGTYSVLSLLYNRSACNPAQHPGTQILDRLDHKSRKFDRLQANVSPGSLIFALGVCTDQWDSR